MATLQIYVNPYGEASVFEKMPLKTHQGALTVEETLARLSTELSKDSLLAGTFLTTGEVQSLHEEMVRDGTHMKKWLAAQHVVAKRVTNRHSLE